MNIFAILLQLIPTILAEIIQIQQSFHNQPGPVKQATAVKNTFAAHPEITATPEVTAAIKAVIDQSVLGLKVASVAGFTAPLPSTSTPPKAPVTAKK